MLVLHFGPIVASLSRNGRIGSVGSYTLHIQCPWRIDSVDNTVTGSADLREYAGPCEFTPENWSYEDGSSLQDHKLNELFGTYQTGRGGGWFSESAKFEVTDVICNKYGELKVSFPAGYTLSAFPAGNIEAWRFFAPGNKDEHLVFPPERTRD